MDLTAEELTALQETHEGASEEEMAEHIKAAEAEKEANAGKSEDEIAAEKEAAEKEAAEKEAAEKAAADKKAAEDQVPDKYELNLGEDSLLSPDRLDEIALTAKEQGLSNKAAQERVTMEEEAVESHVSRMEDEAEETYKAWAKEIEEDKVLGGEHLTETKELVTRAMEHFSNEGLNEMLEATNMKENPGFIRFVAKIGKAMGDDKFFPTKASKGSDDKSNAEMFYGEVDGQS